MPQTPPASARAAARPRVHAPRRASFRAPLRALLACLPALPLALLAPPAGAQRARPAAANAPNAASNASPAALPRDPAPVDSLLVRGMKWRQVGPNRGGRSIAVAGSARRPLEYWFGAVGGGVWRSTDGGQSWAPTTDGQLRSSSVGALAVAPSNPDVVYAGMGETCLRGNVMQGDGVYRTADGGKTWTHLGLAETQAIAKIRVHPTNPDIAWVAAFGPPTGPSEHRGVYKTTDGGKSWRRVLFRGPKAGAIDLSLDAKDPNVLYAATWEAYRITYQMSSGGAGSGLFKSTDGGETWTELTRAAGLPRGTIGRVGVSVSPVDARRVWAMVEAEDGGLFRSDDAGATWRRTNDERKLRQRAFYYTHVTADPQDRDRVYVQNVSFWRSDDGGVTFDSSLVGSHGDHHDLWIAPDDNRRMVQANDGGGAVSVNAGKTWTRQDFPTAQLYHVTTTGHAPYHVCGAQQDNTTLCLPSRGWENLRSARDEALGEWMYDVGGGESGYIANDPTDPDVFFAGSQGALLTRYDRRNGQIRDVQVYPRFFSGEPASALKERWQWTYPIVFAPTNPRVLYTSSQHLWRTTDAGQSWTRLSPDLTRADPATLGFTGGPITKDMNGPEIYGTIFAVAPSPLDSSLIWTGSDDGLAHVTRDGGRTWANVTPPGLPKYARVSMIAASAHAAGTAYLAAKHYLLGDRAPYLYRTRDFGHTWTRIVAGIRADDYVHAVREDPTRAGLLYIGTEHGVYASWDDGASWKSLRLDLPDTQVPDLVVERNDLVIATHGRSMYVLDDIAPLREAYPDAMRPAGAGRASDGRALRLHAPRVATRGVDEALVQYTLDARADSVRVEILDARGTRVRAWTGTGTERDAARRDSTRGDAARGPGALPNAPRDTVARTAARDTATRSATAPSAVAPNVGTPNVGTPNTGTSGAAAAAAPRDTILEPTGCETRRRGDAGRPTGRAGLNRFTWNLRWPGATTFPCMILWSANAEAGPLAVPGTYTVRVTAWGGATPRTVQERPLVVRADPRLVGVTTADLEAQFALLVEIRDRVSAANDAVRRIRALRSGIAARTAMPNAAADVVRGGEAAAARLRAIEEELYQVRNRSGQDPLNFPIRLNNRLASLGRSVATGDARPTDAARVVFGELSAELDAVLKRLDAVVASEVRAFERVSGAPLPGGALPVPAATTADAADAADAAS